MKKFVILLISISLLITACKPAPKPESQLPPTRSADLLVLAYATDVKGEAIGVSAKVKVTVEPNPEKDVRVGFYESEVFGSGPMWRSSGWMAAVVGTYLQGKQLYDYRFAFDVAGQIDGPSAGALKTTGVLSCLVGDKLKEEVTMTGTINPDGTIGPVGGIPQKLEAAAKAGKKLVLVPVGQRYDYDAKAKKIVDVVDHGHRLGLEVREVGDIYEVYRHFTGLALPQPEGLTETRPELPSTAYEKTKSKAKEWAGRYQEEKARFNVLPRDIREYFAGFMVEADSLAKKADDYLKQGMVAAAYSSTLLAALYAMMAHQLGRLTELAYSRGFSAAEDNLKTSLSAMLKVDAVIDRLKAESPRTLADALALIGAYGYLSIAIGLRNSASSLLVQKPEKETKEKAFERLTIASLLLSTADYVAEASKDFLDIGVGFGTAPPPSEDQLNKLAEAFRRTAEANIVYFDSSFLEPMAQKQGVSLSAMKSMFAGIDFTYVMATSSLYGLPYVKERLGTGIAQSYATLGSSLQSYTLSSGLIAKWYSLQVKLDQANNIVGVEKEKALIEMLDLAERKARQNIQLAVSVGAEPVVAMLAYEGGKVAREGKMEDKLGSLPDFWLASALSLIAYQLSGKSKYVR